jgi:Fe-S-cluster containining protein
LLIYSEPFERWKCVYKKCNAQCCVGGREVTAGDIERISKATGQKPEEFADLNHKKGLFRLKSREGKCIFLDGNSCTLHKKGTKPLFCQMYPFKFDGIIYADEIVLKVRVVKDCPGFGEGPEIGEDFEITIEELGNKAIKEIKDFFNKDFLKG